MPSRKNTQRVWAGGPRSEVIVPETGRAMLGVVGLNPPYASAFT